LKLEVLAVLERRVARDREGRLDDVLGRLVLMDPRAARELEVDEARDEAQLVGGLTAVRDRQEPYGPHRAVNRVVRVRAERDGRGPGEDGVEILEEQRDLVFRRHDDAELEGPRELLPSLHRRHPQLIGVERGALEIDDEVPVLLSHAASTASNARADLARATGSTERGVATGSHVRWRDG